MNKSNLSTQRIMMFIIVGILMISMVSAWEWDNVRDYNETTKTITVTNALGLGEKVADIRLETPLHNKVGVGYVKVAEFTINAEDYYDNALQDMEFFDLKKDWKSISRGFDYKYKTNETRDTWKYVCAKDNSSCEKQVFQKEYEVWKDYSVTTVPKGELTIGIFTNTEEGDYVEWIPTMFGERIDEWADWNASLDTGLIQAYAFNETTGDLIELVNGSVNGTVAGTPTRELTSGCPSGINSAYVFDGSDDEIGLGSTVADFDDGTIAIWFNWSNSAGDNLGAGNEEALFGSDGEELAFMHDDTEGTMRVYIDDTKLIQTSASGWFDANDWTLMILQWDASGDNTVLKNGNGTVLATSTGAFGVPTPANLKIGEMRDLGRNWEGAISEFMIWNRNLTANEIATLYDSGNGMSKGSNGSAPSVPEAPNVTLNSPVDYYNSSSNSITFNWSATDDYNVTNSTLYLSNGSIETFTFGTGNETTFQTTIGGWSDGTYTWNATALDNATLQGNSSQRNFTVDTTAPSVSITPISNFNYYETGTNLQVNFSVSDATSGLDTCWYSWDSGATNTTVTCGDNNFTTNITHNNNDSVTLYANDSVGNENSDTNTWDYVVFENNNSYSSDIYETEETTFILDITYNSSDWSSVSADLIWNGTAYDATTTGSGNTIDFEYNLSVPVVTTAVNVTFNWSVSLTNSTGTFLFNSSNVNQTVNPITVSICNTSDAYINFSTYKIESGYPAVNATFEASFDVRLAGTTSSNFSHEDTTEDNRSWSFCITPASKNYTISADVEYDGTGWAKSFYYIINDTYDNATSNISLYLLNDSDATATVLEVQDETQSAVSNALVFVQLYDIGTDTFKTVTMGKTSTLGEDLVYLNWYDSLYKFVITQGGETLLTTNPYKVSGTPQIFSIDTETTFEFKKFDDFEYALYYNSTSKNFVLTFVKPSGDVDSGCLRVIKRNQTDDTLICETCETSSSATVYCNIGSSGNGTFIASFYATGSLKFIDMISELVGLQQDIYNEIGSDNGAVLSIMIAGLALVLFAITPVLMVVGILFAYLVSIALGFTPLIDYGLTITFVILGGVVIWLLKR